MEVESNTIRKYVLKDKLIVETETNSWSDFFISLIGDMITVYK